MNSKTLRILFLVVLTRAIVYPGPYVGDSDMGKFEKVVNGITSNEMLRDQVVPTPG
jgi:hypothetical protein